MPAVRDPVDRQGSLNLNHHHKETILDIRAVLRGADELEIKQDSDTKKAKIGDLLAVMPCSDSSLGTHIFPFLLFLGRNLNPRFLEFKVLFHICICFRLFHLK